MINLIDSSFLTNGRYDFMNEVFIHAVDPANWHPCWNLRIANRLCSVDVADSRANMLGQHNKVRDIPIEKLEKGYYPSGFLQPRFANLLTSGDRRIWDIETVLEKYRREFNPEAPSRLSCLYLAEDTDDGRRNILEMFGDKVVILRTKIILNERKVVVDRRWYDSFYNFKDVEYAKKYWTGEAQDKLNPRWEILLDGVIEVIEDDNYEYLLKHGAKIEGLKGTS